MRQYTVNIRCMYDVTEWEINYLYVCSCFDVTVNSNCCGQIMKGFDILWDCYSTLGCHLKSIFAPTQHTCISYIIFIPTRLYIAENIEYLRNRSSLAVSCCIIIHCFGVSIKADQITSAQRCVQLTDKQ